MWKPWHKCSFCSYSVLFSPCTKLVLKLTTLKVLIWPANIYNALCLWRGSLACKLGQWTISCRILMSKMTKLNEGILCLQTLYSKPSKSSRNVLHETWFRRITEMKGWVRLNWSLCTCTFSKSVQSRFMKHIYFLTRL